MKKTIQFACLAFLLCGALSAQAQIFVQAKPGKEAFYKLYNKALAAHTTSKFRDAEDLYYQAMAEEKRSMEEGSWEYSRALTLLGTALQIHGYPVQAEKPTWKRWSITGSTPKTTCSLP